MSYRARYDKGDWIALCDVCGRKFKAHLLKKRWDGLMCCSQDWEIRQPQDFVRGQSDTQIAPWIRSEPADQFIPIGFWQTLSVTVSCIATEAHPLPTYKTPESVTSTSSATINVRVIPGVSAGARQINGSAINVNSIG